MRFTYADQNGQRLSREEAAQHIKVPSLVVVTCVENKGVATIENISGVKRPLHVFDVLRHHVGDTNRPSDALDLAETAAFCKS